MAGLLAPRVKSKIGRTTVLSIILVFFIYFFLWPSPGEIITNDELNQQQHSKSFSEIPPKSQSPRALPNPVKKVKATFVTLARNADLWELLSSIQSIEDRFNSKFGYDWVFLNDEPFTDEFIEETTKSISGTTKYGVIPYDQWSVPLWINSEKFKEAREDMASRGVIYGDSISYRHMCRYESGFFFRHPLMDEYEYYWRVEPSVKFYCDINYDIFKFMKQNDYQYGFTIAMQEYRETIPTLWDKTVEFMDKYPHFIAEENSMPLISDDDGASYNLCHFWSNFEIGKLDFLRSKAYLSYFEYLDKAGGFFYERWGDAPVHSIAASLFLDKEQIHYFDDVGYYHGPFTSCPRDEKVRKEGRCSCNPKEDFSFQIGSCMNKYYKFRGIKKPSY